MDNSQKEIAMLGGNGDRGNSRQHCNSNEAQRQRLIERLLIVGMIDTITARRELDILCPAARVLELRKRGHRIDTVKIQRATDCGKLHRIALYVLRPEGGV
jgi:hypothetical protein